MTTTLTITITITTSRTLIIIHNNKTAQQQQQQQRQQQQQQHCDTQLKAANPEHTLRTKVAMSHGWIINTKVAMQQVTHQHKNMKAYNIMTPTT